MSFLTDQNLLNSNQHGFISGKKSTDLKSPSARTITLRSSDSSAASPNDAQPNQSEEDAAKQSTDHSHLRGESEAEEDQAAVKIQAVFRGHQSRKSMKQPANKVEAATAASSEEPTREQLENEFREDDKELCDAATKIQASFRGHMTRKQEAEKKGDESGSSQEKNAEEELDIDLTDPDLNNAALKIQASFRGHMVRKENEAETTHN
ncbi:hypothetical protein JTB14_032121 [Gonioctena quinquepunctata]|nr:hypothetical protein JTB14_032121 [Gonioctena quinquepunctata]